MTQAFSPNFISHADLDEDRRRRLCLQQGVSRDARLRRDLDSHDALPSDALQDGEHNTRNHELLNVHMVWPPQNNSVLSTITEDDSFPDRRERNPPPTSLTG